jgi:hypothetical protein
LRVHFGLFATAIVIIALAFLVIARAITPVATAIIIIALAFLVIACAIMAVATAIIIIALAFLVIAVAFVLIAYASRSVAGVAGVIIALATLAHKKSDFSRFPANFGCDLRAVLQPKQITWFPAACPKDPSSCPRETCPGRFSSRLPLWRTAVCPTCRSFHS